MVVVIVIVVANVDVDVDADIDVDADVDVDVNVDDTKLHRKTDIQKYRYTDLFSSRMHKEKLLL